MWKRLRRKIGVVQNLGWLDRVIRVIAGTLGIAVPSALLFSDVSDAWWIYTTILLSVYPLLSGMLGWDPLYSTLGIKSCDTSDINQCGTFPYEIDAALGRDPIPHSSYERTLTRAHHDNDVKKNHD